ncbi:hypothetical protein [Salegentibacter flavus]|uniref:Uncharacterized protein n=1 Tax=Salegentibacter flavus TaxID=287099 RepID=A0A1I4Z3V2_9FLAO|nr:hypothetical protein [Salegentibacter flavus]SFN44941.1 hypothetical protein SAMN05660413_01074 [Salegentibacter flavus]
MSKNGSKSAHKYLGNSWGLSKSHRSDSSIFTTKSQEAKKKELIRKTEQRERRKRTREQYNSLCNKFGIKKRKNDPVLQIIKGKFCGLKHQKDRQLILDNIINFEKYCEHFGETFNLHRYYNLEWYKINFHKDYPEIFSETDSEFNRNAAAFEKKNTLRNNVSQEAFVKLLEMKHKLRK